MYTLDFSEIDNGDPNSKERKNIEKYIDRFWHTGISIDTSITICKYLLDDKATNMRLYSPAFCSNIYNNAFSMAVIQLASYFSFHKDDASFYDFFEYCENHKDQIFTKEFYEEKIGIEGSKTRVDMGTFEERIEKAKELISNNQKLVEDLKSDRSKFYAHFDKKGFLQGRERLITKIEQLKQGLNLVDDVLNTIGVFYDRANRSFQLANRNDVSIISNIVDFYVRNKAIIIDLKSKGVLN